MLSQARLVACCGYRLETTARLIALGLAGLDYTRPASSVMDDTERSHDSVAMPAHGIPGPGSRGLEMNAAARPALRAAARSASCAAASMISPGSSPSTAAGRRYASMIGLKAFVRCEPRIRSQGSPPDFAMSSRREVFPFDSGPTM